MCGICGAFDFKGRAIDRSLIQRMSAVISHRGPDGSGSYVSGEIGLGHRRLSIIDLQGGAQPISNEDGTLQVVFNGEIYNFVELREELAGYGHRFETRSDTEVIVHAYEQWGPGCVTRFNGIFSFALWDNAEKQLLLARDHLGVKPLYYVTTGSRLLFASEIKSLLQHQECPRDVDIEALGALFTLRYVPSPNTLFQGIKKLPPAHILLVGSQGLQVKRYWTATPKRQEKPDEHELIETYQSLVEDAVRLQMRSDVPVGLFLSSGVDSSALLALMSRVASEPVRTFTIGFEDGEKSNETQDARAIAEQFGAEHHEMIVQAKDYEDYYERYLWDIEEPVGNETAAAFYFVSMIASSKVKVALTGQGADEPWAGYHRHIGVKLSELYSRVPRFLTDSLVKPAVDRFAKNERARRAVFSLSEADVLTRFVKIYS